MSYDDNLYIVMKKILMIFTYLLVATTMQAQAKYCDSDADFVGRKWKEMPNVKIVYKRANNYDYDIAFETGDKETDKFLKKSNYYMMWEDSLYINTRRAMQNLGDFDGYAKAIVLTDDRFFFISPKIVTIIMPGYRGGIIGGALAGIATGVINGTANAAPCYIYNMLTSSSHVIDEDYMKKLMKNSPDLWKQYKKEKRKEKQDPEVIKEYLRKLGLIENRQQ